MNQDPILLWLTVLPLLGAIACFAVSDRFSRIVALVTSLIGFALSLMVYHQFDADSTAPMQMVYAIPWIQSFRIQFSLGIDGLSLPLVMLTKLMVPIAILASWSETRKLRAFMSCYLMLDMAMVGTFLATDIFLFYVFWEVMLIPMLLIIGVWGSDNRIFASIKFFLYTFAGSVLMLVAIFWIFSAHNQQMGYYTGLIASYYELTFSEASLFMGLNSGELIFLAFAIAFAIKIPLFPLHTWLPDAHVQAPAGGSILLAAVLLKMGAYGLLRFCIPICPTAFVTFVPLIVTLSLMGIVYGAWVAFHQTDLKKLVAYSSVSHVGFITLGICAMNNEAFTGAMLQMINHGLSTGGLFLLVGAIYSRRHTREMGEFGGLAKQIPWFAIFLVFIACSSMGVPGLNGFVGEFLILLGTFKTNALWAIIAVTGVVFGAAYMLLMLRNVLFGPLQSSENKKLKDLNSIEWAAIIPLCIMIIWLGIYPQFFLNKVNSSFEVYWSQSLKNLYSEIPATQQLAPTNVDTQKKVSE